MALLVFLYQNVSSQHLMKEMPNPLFCLLFLNIWEDVLKKTNNLCIEKFTYCSILNICTCFIEKAHVSTCEMMYSNNPLCFCNHKIINLEIIKYAFQSFESYLLIFFLVVSFL